MKLSKIIKLDKINQPIVRDYFLIDRRPIVIETTKCYKLIMPIKA